MTRPEVEEVYRQTFRADTFFMSTNALTENGELYNVDGNSNRVAALLYGPKSVIVVCGINKIVKNIDEALRELKQLPLRRIQSDSALKPLAEKQANVFH
jgi:hypothetical protein